LSGYIQVLGRDPGPQFSRLAFTQGQRQRQVIYPVLIPGYLLTCGGQRAGKETVSIPNPAAAIQPAVGLGNKAGNPGNPNLKADPVPEISPSLSLKAFSPYLQFFQKERVPFPAHPDPAGHLPPGQAAVEKTPRQLAACLSPGPTAPYSVEIGIDHPPGLRHRQRRIHIPCPQCPGNRPSPFPGNRCPPAGDPLADIYLQPIDGNPFPGAGKTAPDRQRRPGDEAGPQMETALIGGQIAGKLQVAAKNQFPPDFRRQVETIDLQR